MATGIAGIWNQVSTTHAAATAHAADSHADGNSTAGAADSASISAHDSLTLLVTEMQNQDPTATTDPNEYINQLVQVNSLEQLISINQTLTADSAASANAGLTRNPEISNPPVVNNARAAERNSAPPSTAPIPHAAGNLTIPEANPAALHVAQSLAGQSKTH